MSAEDSINKTKEQLAPILSKIHSSDRDCKKRTLSRSYPQQGHHEWCGCFGDCYWQ